jgi:hypothetical protein
VGVSHQVLDSDHHCGLLGGATRGSIKNSRTQNSEPRMEKGRRRCRRIRIQKPGIAWPTNWFDALRHRAAFFVR